MLLKEFRPGTRSLLVRLLAFLSLLLIPLYFSANTHTHKWIEVYICYSSHSLPFPHLPISISSPSLLTSRIGLWRQIRSYILATISLCLCICLWAEKHSSFSHSFLLVLFFLPLLFFQEILKTYWKKPCFLIDISISFISIVQFCKYR
jgi:hypothetical protein